MTPTPHQPQYVEVVDQSTDEVVHRIDVTGKSTRNIEKIAMGLLRKIDTDKFFVTEPQ